MGRAPRQNSIYRRQVGNFGHFEAAKPTWPLSLLSSLFSLLSSLFSLLSSLFSLLSSGGKEASNKWGAHAGKNAFPDNKWGAHPGKTAFLDNKWVTLVTSRLENPPGHSLFSLLSSLFSLLSSLFSLLSSLFSLLSSLFWGQRG